MIKDLKKNMNIMRREKVVMKKESRGTFLVDKT